MERERMVEELSKIVGKENVLSSETDLLLYGYDASLFKGKPDCIAFPGSTQEVSQIVRFCHREKIPVIARGSGTNLSGGTIPTRGGIILHFSRMNKIIEIDIENQRAVVEPGLFTLVLKNQLARHGFIYQPDPASEKVSTFGGNFGENSGGPHCLKYGVTTNHILGAEIVLSDGEVIWVGGKALDNPGYDLTGILVGSEGTLGIATKLILRIMPKPEAVKTLLAIYNTLEDAGRTVSAIIADGIVPATLEMLDKLTIKAVEESIHAGFPLDAEAVLLIELDGLRDGMERLTERVMEICRKNSVREVKAAKTEAERTQLWAGRKGAFGAIARLRPNYLVCDGTVPRTKLPGVLTRVMEVGRKYDLTIANVFHAGDGNLHPLILFDERNEEELRKVHLAGSEIMKLCAEAGGTISGEHGIGTEKMKEMFFVFTPEDIIAMKKVKRAFDPEDIYNPGKVLPEIQA
ncbi:MAG: FAD-linked oxidase C-terminal domain-containing protein [Thermodesulfobacteriota bacterium]|nr:FAD-linked oxidase C-terminal domain-containing protein [Thermodesulfobacteriota bacterium]